MEALLTVEKRAEFKVGNLKVARLDVDHSILGASAYLIEAGDRNIAYTGDIRFRGNVSEDSEEFLQICKKTGIDILMCEGTRVGPLSEDEQEVESHVLSGEAEVEEKCREIFSREDNLIIYDASPADVNRMGLVCRVAQEYGRRKWLMIGLRQERLTSAYRGNHGG